MAWPNITRQHYNAQLALNPQSIASAALRKPRAPKDRETARREHVPQDLPTVMVTKATVAITKPLPVKDHIDAYLSRIRPKQK